ncbi:hypothetical protein LCGC14_1519890 [marine sediment metagenome]|uniref:Uncharacterized protein n=1 Tax=marine sediment metagenome TaxID=412755 RepID=A0A0F9LEK0_9ZZZZ
MLELKERLYLSTYGNTEATMPEIIEHFGKLPTVKTSHCIIRQKGHPLGDWEAFKPTRKHKYFVRVF